MKDSPTLRRYAREQIGHQYTPTWITYQGRDYQVFFEWCDDDEVNDQDQPMNGVVMFEPEHSRNQLSYHYAFMVRRRATGFVLDELDIHPNIEDDLEAQE